MKKLFSTLSIIFLLSPLSVLALNFDGSNDFVQIQDSSIFDVGNAGSWCLWFYSNAAQSQKAYLCMMWRQEKPQVLGYG